jgi:TonB family protein
MQNFSKPDFFPAFFISIILHFLLLGLAVSFTHSQKKNLSTATKIINLRLSTNSYKPEKISISAPQKSIPETISAPAVEKLEEKKPALEKNSSNPKNEQKKIVTEEKLLAPTPKKRPKIKREMPQPSFGVVENPPSATAIEAQNFNHNLRYELVFSSWLRRFQFYPEEAGEAVGRVQCAIRLNRQGSVQSVVVLASSGNEALDKSMQQAVMMASPFPIVPEDFRPTESEIQLVTELFYAPERSN